MLTAATRRVHRAEGGSGRLRSSYDWPMTDWRFAHLLGRAYKSLTKRRASLLSIGCDPAVAAERRTPRANGTSPLPCIAVRGRRAACQPICGRRQPQPERSDTGLRSINHKHTTEHELKPVFVCPNV